MGIGGIAMNDFVAALLVLMALAAVGNFAADGSAMGNGCVGSHDAWLQVCR